MSYFIARQSFHHSCFRSLIIRVSETKLGLFNYNEFAMYPFSKSIQPSLNQSPLNQSKPASSHILPSNPSGSG